MVQFHISNRKNKKLIAVFKDSSTVHFGDSRFYDYTSFPAEIRDIKRERYLKRHGKEDWTDPKKASTLARYILWELPSLRDSIADYKRRFPDV